MEHLDQMLIPNIYKMITVWLSLAIMFFIFYKKFWKNFKEYTDKRKDFVVKQVSEAEESNKTAIDHEKNAADALKQARIDSKEMIDRSRGEAIKVKEQIIDDAKSEASGQLEHARLQIAREEQELRKELEGEITDIALSAAREVVKGSIDEKQGEAIVDDFIKELNA